MFDRGAIADLDANRTADALAESRDRLIAEEARQLYLAAHWADLNAPEYVEDRLALCADAAPGQERVVPGGADGCPELGEFAAGELGALLSRSTGSAQNLLADALNLRHRHPLAWGRIGEGSARVWLAVQVARRCARARLKRDQARWVDAETTPYLGTLPTSRFLDLVEAKIIEADPAAAEARAESMRMAQYVRATQSDEEGMRVLVARAHAGDVTYLVAVVDRIAEILASRGDTDLVDVRRAKALRILANPARALAMLTGAELAAAEAGVADDPLSSPVDDPELDPLAWVVDGQGRALPGYVRPEDLTEVDPEIRSETVTLGALPAVFDATEQQGDHEERVQALRSLATSLEGFDASTFDPLSVFYVHVSAESLDGGAGAGRVEGLGPTTLGRLKSWLGDAQSGHRVRLRPVIDARDVVPVDRYELPAAMREASVVCTPYEVFPFGTTASRKADQDHAKPFVGRPGSGQETPAGQTSLDNLCPLGRRAHRMKTHGRWVLRSPQRGVHLWRSPHGHWFRVDPSGTHHLGRDPRLDQLLPARE